MLPPLRAPRPERPPPAAGPPEPIVPGAAGCGGRRDPGALDPGARRRPLDVLDGATVLLVDGHHVEAAVTAAAAARRQGVPVLFDGGSWKEGTERLLEHVDVALVSGDFSPPDGSDALAFLARAGCRVAARSDGHRPIVGLVGDERFVLPVDQVDAVDTLGAGDVLHGALAHHLATSYEGPRSVPQLLRAASVVASASVGRTGARGWHDDLDTVVAAARRALEG